MALISIEFYHYNNFELYNLENDISEENNLSKTHPNKAKELRKKLNKWQKKMNAKMPKTNPDYIPN